MNCKRTYFIFLAVLVTGCFFLSACENDPEEVNELYKKKIGVEEAKDIELIYTSGGKTKAILKAPIMLRVQDTFPYVEFPNSLSTHFFNEAGEIESKLTAKYGKYQETKSVVFLRDSVKVINILQGDTLYCMELYWDRSRSGREFYTEKPVRIRTRTQILDGIGLEASQDFKQKTILKPTGVLSIPSSDLP